MTDLTRLESDDPAIAGVLFSFPSGLKKVASWQSDKPVDVNMTARKITESMIEALLQLGVDGESDLRNTNWVSVAACCQRLADQFNSSLISR